MARITTSGPFTQADGIVVVETTSDHYPDTQVSFGGTFTAGTLGIRVKYHRDARFEQLLGEDGLTPVTVDLADASLESFQLFKKWVHSFEFTPTGVTGDYTVCIMTGTELTA